MRKGRTVILTHELRDCTVPLAKLRKSRVLIDVSTEGGILQPAQTTATVAQPSAAPAKATRK